MSQPPTAIAANSHLQQHSTAPEQKLDAKDYKQFFLSEEKDWHISPDRMRKTLDHLAIIIGPQSEHIVTIGDKRINLNFFKAIGEWTYSAVMEQLPKLVEEKEVSSETQNTLLMVAKYLALSQERAALITMAGLSPEECEEYWNRYRRETVGQNSFCAIPQEVKMIFEFFEKRFRIGRDHDVPFYAGLSDQDYRVVYFHRGLTHTQVETPQGTIPIFTSVCIHEFLECATLDFALKEQLLKNGGKPIVFTYPLLDKPGAEDQYEKLVLTYTLENNLLIKKRHVERITGDDKDLVRYLQHYLQYILTMQEFLKDKHRNLIYCHGSCELLSEQKQEIADELEKINEKLAELKVLEQWTKKLFHVLRIEFTFDLEHLTVPKTEPCLDSWVERQAHSQCVLYYQLTHQMAEHAEQFMIESMGAGDYYESHYNATVQTDIDNLVRWAEEQATSGFASLSLPPDVCLLPHISYMKELSDFKMVRASISPLFQLTDRSSLKKLSH